jgi:hypothetical protein
MDSSYKALARPAYLLAFLFLVIPVADAVMTVWPLRFDDERWRFGAVGSFSGITLVPLLGLFVAVTVAIVLDHRRTRKLIGWVSALGALFFAVVLVVFVLDYFQTRAGVRAQFQEAMDVASYTSMIKQFMTIVALALLSDAGIRGPKPVSASKKAKAATPNPEPTPLISAINAQSSAAK